jgi:hypothetical protein
MNKQYKINFIRQKCVGANPEIVKRTAVVQVGKLTVMGIENTIRLADVVLAVKSMHVEKLKHSAEYYMAITPLFGINATPQWNLRADDLEKQSQETTSFLYELLK